ncbi:MAG: N-acetylmuramoyl-L-alanine amidase [Muribaculaceae bacterium]|nr:N-acetylmuramoyl-L-alanine amidase [Muribaculaceae bacterium]
MRLILRFILLTLLLLPVQNAGAKDFVVVLDPGHGGKDAGALGLRSNEKTINLTVAKKLKDLIESNMKDAKVEMTRSNDTFVKLQGRADFANTRKADVFISIHANSLGYKTPGRDRVHGAAVYTLGLDRSDTNLSVAMRENEVMKLEDDYTTTYEGFDPSSAESYIAFEMMQHKNMDQSIALAEYVQNQLVRTAGRKNNGVRQAPFWVLVRTSMPAILVELDFISNPTQEKFMMSEAGSTKLARAIYNGLERYRNRTVNAVPANKVAKTEKNDTETTKETTKETVSQPPVPQASSTGKADGDIIYKIQFLTSPRVLPAGHKNFKGLTNVEHYEDNGMVKYTIGSYSSLSEANKDLKEVKKKFSDSFVIKTRDGKRIK